MNRTQVHKLCVRAAQPNHQTSQTTRQRDREEWHMNFVWKSQALCEGAGLLASRYAETQFPAVAALTLVKEDIHGSLHPEIESTWQPGQNFRDGFKECKAAYGNGWVLWWIRHSLEVVVAQDVQGSGRSYEVAAAVQRILEAHGDGVTGAPHFPMLHLLETALQWRDSSWWQSLPTGLSGLSSFPHCHLPYRWRGICSKQVK